ncbi:MAG: MBL fold metallo-hydrolase [Chloroflexi bacterium]|nr:MBL fold metallo-hydrolase [Chloroflexota bacterium]MBU1748219.1 MBL fold metallo-hydrolase [Chloroflexota bacterium]
MTIRHNVLAMLIVSALVVGCEAAIPTPTSAPAGNNTTAIPSGTSAAPGLAVVTPVPATATAAPTTMPTTPPRTGRGGVIAFVSERDGNVEIYTINADGSNERRLTNDKGRDFAPAWSPDGTQITFASSRDGNDEIYTMGADGSNPRRLTQDSASDGFSTWSPDGTQIAFDSDRSGNWDIYVASVDGSEQGLLDVRQLTDARADDGIPTWSPDGTQIAFESLRDGNYEIYVVNVDGSNLRRLTDRSATDGFPAWSPDGTQIAFTSQRDGNAEIYVVDVSSGNLRRLTENDVEDGFPTWSPDGTQIAFASRRDGNLEIYVTSVDGTEPSSGDIRPLTNNKANDYSPAWRPDAAAVAITYVENDSFLINAHGKTILTDPPERIPPEARRLIEQAQPPFDAVDLVLITHAHSDHFDPQLIRAHLEHNPRAILISTEETVERLKADFSGWSAMQDRIKAVEPQEGERIPVTANGISLEILNLPHGIPITNLGFIINLGGRKLLHTGDMNQASDLETYELARANIDIAFVPYFFLIDDEFLDADGHNMVLAAIQARHVVPMHYSSTDRYLISILNRIKARVPTGILFHETLETQIVE